MHRYNIPNSTMRYYKFQVGDTMWISREDFISKALHPTIVVGFTLDEKVICMTMSSQKETIQRCCKDNYTEMITITPNEAPIETVSYMNPPDALYIVTPQELIKNKGYLIPNRKAKPVVIERCVRALLGVKQINHRIKEALISSCPGVR